MTTTGAVALLERSARPDAAASTSPPSAGRLSAFQARTLTLPEVADLVLDGGRGGGKDIASVFLILRHAEQYGDRARVLYIRRSYKGLADAELNLREVFGATYGRAARYNAAEHIWRLPNGAYVELGQLSTHEDYQKYQGRSFTLLLVSECQQWPSPDLLDLLRSNLRAPAGIPLRTVLLANPGDVGSGWFAKRYVFASEPWIPTVEDATRRTFIRCPSTYLDNPFIDREQYAEQLRASAPTNPELVKAWLTGDWTAIAGVFFGSVLNEKASALPELTPDAWRSTLPPAEKPVLYGPLGKIDTGLPPLEPVSYFLAHDWGSAKPSVTFLMGRAQTDFTGIGGRHFRKGSLFLLDEVATAVPGDPNRGLEYEVPRVAELILAMVRRWGVEAKGTADDAIFSEHGHSAGSIAKEFSSCGVLFYPSGKGGRVAGWELLKQLMAGAAAPDRPGFYASRNCRYFWETAPFLNRDRRNPEDLDSDGPDHGADAARYGAGFKGAEITFGKLSDYI